MCREALSGNFTSDGNNLELGLCAELIKWQNILTLSREAPD